MKRKLLAIGIVLLYIGGVLMFAVVTKINLATQVHGVLAVSNAGSGASTANANTFLSGPLVGAAAAYGFKNSHLLFPDVAFPAIRKFHYSVATMNTYGTNGLGGCGGNGGIANSGNSSAINPLYNAATSGTTSGNTATLPNSCQNLARWDSSPLIQIMAGGSAITNNRQWIGATSSVLGAVDDATYDGMAFRYSTAAGDVHWQCATNNNSGTSNFVDSGVTPDTNLHKFQMYYDSGSLTAYFWIDGISVCGPVTAQVPRSNQVLSIWQSCTTLLTGQSCQAKVAWVYLDADK